MDKKRMIGLGAIVSSALLFFTTRKKKIRGLQVVKPFNLERFMGKWYEIARLDYSFEKGLDSVSAAYNLNSNGTVSVINRGFSSSKHTWKEVSGKATVQDPHEGRLKVSFSGPFWSGYNVVAIDQEYQYALVAGDDLNHLWLLSRKPKMPEQISNHYVKLAQELGYHTDKLVWVRQEQDVPHFTR